MCFVLNYEWRASINEDNVTVAEKATSCDECGCFIHKGQWIRKIYQQEREECLRCGEPSEMDEDFERSAEPCPEGECDFGETFSYERCELCDKLLQAIKAAELAEGCREHESQPYLTELWEAMWEDRDGRYAEVAAKMFPELAMSGHLLLFGEVFDNEHGWERCDLEEVDELGGEG